MDILKAREEKPFESFEDIKNRVPMLSDPVKLIVRRVLMELDVEAPNGENVSTTYSRDRPSRGGADPSI